jgi:hypothetical protein
MLRAYAGYSRLGADSASLRFTPLFDLAGVMCSIDTARVHGTLSSPPSRGCRRGNVLAALVFLSLNDIDIEAEEEAFEQAVLAVAEGKWGKADIAAFLRDHARPKSSGEF